MKLRRLEPRLDHPVRKQGSPALDLLRNMLLRNIQQRRLRLGPPPKTQIKVLRLDLEPQPVAPVGKVTARQVREILVQFIPPLVLLVQVKQYQLLPEGRGLLILAAVFLFWSRHAVLGVRVLGFLVTPTYWPEDVVVLLVAPVEETVSLEDQLQQLMVAVQL